MMARTLRTLARLGIPVLLLVSSLGAILFIQSERPLAESCYADSECLIRASQRGETWIAANNLPRYVDLLARLGLFNEANLIVERFDRNDSTGQLNWRNAINSIAQYQIAAVAWDDTKSIADYAPVQALSRSETQGSPIDIAYQYSNLADTLTHRSTYSLIDGNLSDVLRPKLVRGAGNATVDDLLARKLPNVIQSLPTTQQGWHWNDLANLYLQLGDRDRAVEFADKAEKTGLVNFQGVQLVYDETWRTWLKLGNVSRSLNAIDKVSDVTSATHFYIDLARHLIDHGEKQKAIPLLQKAFPNALADSLPSGIGDRRDIVNLLERAGKPAMAEDALRQVLTRARSSRILFAANLVDAAALSTDLGHEDEAYDLLNEAVRDYFSYNDRFGLGTASGSLTARAQEIGGSQIAVEYFRSDHYTEFDQLTAGMKPFDRHQAWSQICDADDNTNVAHPPSEQDCLAQLGSSFFISRAITKAQAGDNDAVRGYLIQFMSATSSGDATRSPADAVRLAFVIGDQDLLEKTLVYYAKHAGRVLDPGDRSIQLAEAAALRKELFQ